MAAPSVFISSVIRGFEEIRERAAEAARGIGMFPTLSEASPASPDSPRRTLLDEVAKADLYLLLLGERYGDVASGEQSPVEDEYDEAVRSGRPILVLVRKGDLEPRQRQFRDKVRGQWGDGVMYGRFTGPEDVGQTVAIALARYQAGVVEDGPAAQERATALAQGESRQGYGATGVAARVAFVPLRSSTVLEPLALEDPSLGDDLIAALRSSGVVPQRIGMDSKITSAGIGLAGTGADNWTPPRAEIGVNGEISVLASVAVEGGALGFSLVDPDKLEQLFASAGRFAQVTWDRIDSRTEIGRVAVAAAIPDAQHKGFGAGSGSSMSVSMSLPEVVLGPTPAAIAARGELTEPGFIRGLVAAIRRVFADHGALQE